MNITRSISWFLPALLILTACSNEPKPIVTRDSEVEQPVATSADYTAVVDADYPPYGLRNEYGNADGFDVDILKAIAEKQDFSVDILPMHWNSVLDSLNTSTYQIAMGGILELDIDDSTHQANYSFSTPYAYGQDAVATLPSTTGITSFEDLADYRVGVLAESGHVDLIKNLQTEKDGELIAVESTFLAFQGLFLDEVDAVLADEGILRYYKKNTNDAEFDIHQDGERLSKRFEMVYLISKENPELNQKIDMGIQQIVADGTYEDIYQKWFGIMPDVLPNENIGMQEASSD